VLEQHRDVAIMPDRRIRSSVLFALQRFAAPADSNLSYSALNVVQGPRVTGGDFMRKGCVAMRVKIASSLLILGSTFGC